MRKQYWTFLYCSPLSYRSSNFATAIVVTLCLYEFCRLIHGFFSVLLPIYLLLSPLRARKSDNYSYRDSWKSNNFRKEAIKKSKELIPKRMQRWLRVITLQGVIEKSPILLSQYWKNEWLDGIIIISYFGASNNIFADCTCTFTRDTYIILWRLSWLENCISIMSY